MVSHFSDLCRGGRRNAIFNDKLFEFDSNPLCLSLLDNTLGREIESDANY